MKEEQAYGDTSGGIFDAWKANGPLQRKAVLDRMTGELPEEPWANVEILGWRPEDDKLPVDYCFAETPFGRVLAAATPKGVCYLGLAEDKPEEVLSDLYGRFPHTACRPGQTPMLESALGFLAEKRGECVRLHLRGTPYQLRIWKRLIRIPCGKVISYSTLGGSAPHARAAGTANGRNPVFWIVPCHRAVKSDGSFDRYFWGKGVKKRLLEWEFANSPIEQDPGFLNPKKMRTLFLYGRPGGRRLPERKSR